MSIFLNPVVFSVILMCILCLCKLNVMFSLIIACFVGGLMGGMSVSDISSTMLAGFSNNAEAALAYILLGTFASCLAYTGLADIFAKRVAQAIRGSKLKLFLLILIFSIISQTIIPIHTAYIPILIPPMLAMMNEMKMDRRLMAGALVSGMMPYVGIPIGYGLIFMGIVKDNMCANGLTVTVQQVYSVNWMLMLTFIPGIIYIWFRYRKPREYKNVDVDLSPPSLNCATGYPSSRFWSSPQSNLKRNLWLLPHWRVLLSCSSLAQSNGRISKSALTTVFA